MKKGKLVERRLSGILKGHTYPFKKFNPLERHYEV